MSREGLLCTESINHHPVPCLILSASHHGVRSGICNNKHSLVQLSAMSGLIPADKLEILDLLFAAADDVLGVGTIL